MISTDENEGYFVFLQRESVKEDDRENASNIIIITQNNNFNYNTVS